MTSLREFRKRDTKARLFDAAVTLFRERGYEDVSVAEITEASGVSKGTFFNYYPSKGHLLAEYHGRMTDWVIDQVVDVEFDSCEHAIVEYVHRFVDWCERDRGMVEILVRRIFTDAVMFEADQLMVRRTIPWFEQQIERGVNQGEIKRDVDRGAFIALIAAVLSSVGNAWALAGEFDARAEAVRRMQFVFDAARVEPRR